MSELQAVLDGWGEARSCGEPAVLATVVRVSGSAYRRPGARLLIRRDGRRVGGVSGGCLEGDLVRKAWWRTEAGPVVLRYDTSAGDDADGAFGLGCNGVVEVLVERLDPAHPPTGLAAAGRWRAAGRGGVLARVIGLVGDSVVGVGASLALGPDGTAHDFADPELADRVRAGAEAAQFDGRSRSASAEVGGGRVDVFFEVIRLPQALLVCGAGFDAGSLVRQAKAIGWHVTVFDPRAAYPTTGRFPDADVVVAGPAAELADRVSLEPGGAAVLMTHNYEDDRRLLPALLASPLGYVGALGPRRRTESLLADLAATGFAPTPAQLARLHAPVGLDVGAETPEEIALAVVAEVRAATAGRRGGMLRDRPGPIHDRPADGPRGHTAGARPAAAVCSTSDHS